MVNYFITLHSQIKWKNNFELIKEQSKDPELMLKVKIVVVLFCNTIEEVQFPTIQLSDLLKEIRYDYIIGYYNSDFISLPCIIIYISIFLKLKSHSIGLIQTSDIKVYIWLFNFKLFIYCFIFPNVM